MEKIVIEFTVDEINVVLSGLGKLPAEVSYSMISKIKTEAEKQLQPTETPKE